MTSNMMISIYHIDIFHIHKRAHRRIECVWINLPMTYMETRLNFRLRYKMHYSYLTAVFVRSKETLWTEWNKCCDRMYNSNRHKAVKPSPCLIINTLNISERTTYISLQTLIKSHVCLWCASNDKFIDIVVY